MKKVNCLVILFFFVNGLIHAQKVSGHVMGKNNDNIQNENIEIKLYPSSIKTKSDKNGYFEFRNVKAGNYTLQFFHHGNKVQEKEPSADRFIKGSGYWGMYNVQNYTTVRPLRLPTLDGRKSRGVQDDSSR